MPVISDNATFDTANSSQISAVHFILSAVRTAKFAYIILWIGVIFTVSTHSVKVIFFYLSYRFCIFSKYCIIFIGYGVWLFITTHNRLSNISWFEVKESLRVSRLYPSISNLKQGLPSNENFNYLPKPSDANEHIHDRLSILHIYFRLILICKAPHYIRIATKFQNVHARNKLQIHIDISAGSTAYLELLNVRYVKIIA